MNIFILGRLFDFHAIFQECIFTKECWQRLISPLEIRINFEKPLLDFLQTFEKAYPYTTKKKATIQRIWKCIAVVLCWKIWLTRNKCIFKNQIPRIGKNLSKTWGLTSEILNVKGTAPTDYQILQQEERDWLSKAIINNNG